MHHHPTLWTVEQAKHCLQQKLNQRPVSTTSRGLIKISCKDTNRSRIKMIRHINLLRMNSHV